MSIDSLLSREQITAIKDGFAAVEITDADFNRIEVLGDLIRHIELTDNETRQHETRVERLAPRPLSLESR